MYTIKVQMHLSMLTPTTPLTGRGEDSVGVSNIAWLVAPMILHFNLANDDLIPIHLTIINNNFCQRVFKTSRTYACTNAPPLRREFIANSVKSRTSPRTPPVRDIVGTFIDSCII